MMRIPRVSLNISVIITLLLVALPINVVSAAGETFGTGLNAPTAAQTAWMKQNFPIIQKVNLNSLALQRINTERQKNGKSQVSSSSIMLAPMGQEASFTASAAPADTVGDTGPNTVSLPGSVDNSTSSAFPPIRSQGSIGSCAAWATTYYQFTYETNLARGRTASSGDNSNIFSPKWTYDLVNGGQDAGSSFSDCYQVEMKNGAASWAAFPYDTNYLAWPLTGSTWLDALNYRPQTWGQIYNSDVDQEISAIKTQLANGHVLVIGTYVYSWVQKTVGNDPATTDDDAFAGQKIAAYMNGASGGHGMTIVGYNDSIWCDLNGNGVVDSGEKGAFKIANSWGTSDWNSGYRWVSYDAVRQASAVAAYGSWPTSDRYSGGIFCNGTVYSLTVSASYAPSLVAEVTLNAENRGQMVVSLGTSSAVVSQPTTIWYPRALDSTGGNLAFDGTTTACDGTFDIDFSDLTAQYPSNTRWCVGVLDSATGNVTTLKSFKLYQYGILAATASDTPKTADNQQIYDWVTYTLNTVTPSSDATLSNLIISSGTLTPSFTASNISYTASINNSVSTVTVTPTVNQANATVKVNGTAVNSGTASGNINMAVGANTITVAVTAQDTTTVKTYTIVVTRAAALSSDATLSNLVISSGTLTPSFTASNISYTASINNSASTVTVTPTVNQANATVKVNGTAVNSGTASGNINMAVGANTITVAVTAQDTTTVKTCTIVVTRAVNTPPVAVADTGVTTKNHVLNTSAPGVLANDTDVDGNTLTAIKVTDPAHGTLMLNSNGSYTYTPATGFVGTDSFTYKANDSVVDSNVVIVAITVVDDTPPAPPAPPAPPSGGGGGGGGFGGGAVVKKTTPGVADIASIIDAKGLFTDGVTGLSEDNQAVIRIESGTTAAAADGAPFSQITIKKQNEIDNLPKDVSIVGETYDFGPTGVTFSPAVTIRLSYNPRNLPEGVSESGLVIGYYDDKSGNWYSLDSTVDLTGRNVYTQTTHFSTYAILSGPTATQPLAAQVSAPVTPPVEPAVQTVPMPMNIATTPPASDVTWSTPAQTVSSVSPEDNAPATPAIPVSPEPLISSTQPVTTEAAITTTTTALDNTISGTTAGTEISADVHAGNKVPLFVLVLTSVIIGMIGTVVFIRRS
jgi:C1A family cysteine protease